MMSKERYNEIIDDAYTNYIYKQPYLPIAGNNVGKLGSYKNPILSKEEFINKIKTDDEFSEKSSLQIEERELSRDERIDLYCIEYTAGIRGKYEKPFDDFIDAKLTTRNIPTKLITAVYQNEKIEVYE